MCTTNPDFFTLFRRWKADAAVRLGPATIKQYRRYLIATAAEIGKDPCNMSSKELKQYLGALRPQYGQQTRNALQDFYEFAIRKGHLSENPVASVSVKMRGKRKLKRGLTHEELVRLLIAAVSTTNKWFDGTRLAWTILCQYSLGLRPGEICRLSRDRIRLNGSSSAVEIVDTKTGNDRLLPIGPLAREAITELLEHSGNRLVTVGTAAYWEKVRRAGALADLPPEKRRPYALRHTFATHLIEAGVPARHVAELMGHSDMRAIWGYSVPDRAVLESALEKLAPDTGRKLNERPRGNDLPQSDS